MIRGFVGAVLASVVITSAAGVGAQRPAVPPAGATASQQTSTSRQTTPPAVERLGPSLYRIGRMQVDTAKRELSVIGRINDVGTLEFVACVRGGMKAYESAITLETDAISFNAALLLIGLDQTRGRAPARHFDPAPPAGDPVEITFVSNLPGTTPSGREPVEQLLFNQRTQQTIPPGAWVYTGSTLIEGGKYLAEMDGVLIGFVHSPAPVIERVGGLGMGDYGSVILNPSFRSKRASLFTLFVRALPRTPDSR